MRGLSGLSLSQEETEEEAVASDSDKSVDGEDTADQCSYMYLFLHLWAYSSNASSTDWLIPNALYSGDVIQSGKPIEKKEIGEESGSTEGNSHSQMYTNIVCSYEMCTSFLTEICEKVEASGTDKISIQGIHTCILNSQQFYRHKECFQSVVCNCVKDLYLYIDGIVRSQTRPSTLTVLLV